MVNINERRLSAWRRGFITENVDLVGLDYLWKAVLLAPDSIVYKPIELLKDVYTNLSNKLQQDQVCIFLLCVWLYNTSVLLPRSTWTSFRRACRDFRWPMITSNSFSLARLRTSLLTYSLALILKYIHNGCRQEPVVEVQIFISPDNQAGEVFVTVERVCHRV